MTENIIPKTLKGVVHRLYSGPHGPYALALIEDSETIRKLTFSLLPTTWKEADQPREGEIVCLSQLVEKRAGWQAREARFWQMSDEEIRINNLPLDKRLAVYADNRQSGFGRSNVAVRFMKEHPAIAPLFGTGEADINAALESLDEEQKLLLFAEILRDLVHLSDGGRLNGCFIGLTVAANGQQIRVWRGWPEILLKNYAEGEDICLEITGPKETTSRYLAEILHLTNLSKIVLPNGMDLYLNWR